MFLAYQACFSFYLFLCLSAGLFLLSLHVCTWSEDAWSKGATSQVQAKRARMQARRGKPTKGQCSIDQGAQPLQSGFLFLSLSKPFLQSMYQDSPSSCTHLLFLLLAWAAFRGYGNVCLTFPVPCRAIPLECWQCFFYFPTLCDSIVHDECMYIYIYIYIYLCPGVCG